MNEWMMNAAKNPLKIIIIRKNKINNGFGKMAKAKNE